MKKSALSHRVIVGLRSCLFASLFVLTDSSHAQLGYTGGVLVQNFDSLPSSDSFDLSDYGVGKGPALLTAAPLLATSAPGWGIHARVGTQLLFLVGQGSVGTGSAYSYGHHAAQDRALGSLGASGHAATLGWRLTNNTGQTLTSFTLSLFAEQWRNGGTSSLVGLIGEYRIVSSGDIDSGSYTSAPQLDVPPVSAVAGGFAMNGNSPANRTERSVSVSGLNWLPGQMLILRWRDVDETGADNGLAIDDVIFHAPTTSVLPLVQSTGPTSGSENVFGLSPVTVTFNQPVTVSGLWFEITGSTSGAIAATVSNAGPMRYTLTPSMPWPSGETVTVRIIAPQVTNSASQAMTTDHFLTFSTLAPSTSVTPISKVQGTDGSSPLAGAEVTVQGVVVADFQGAAPALGGFYLQEEDSDVDGNAMTSEALWVGDSVTDVAVGDIVRVTGTVSESSSLTQLFSPTAISVQGTSGLPNAMPVSFPVSTNTALERFEGMRVTVPQTLSVTSNSGGTGTTDGFSRFGELLLSSNGPLVTPTEFIDPNDVPASGTSSTGRSNVLAIHDYERQMELRTLILDDASTAQWPDPTPYLNAQFTRRCGDTVTGLSGILTYSSGSYRVQPTSIVTFLDSNPRPASPPVVSGRVKVASMNVLNYFTTFGGANDRGASNATEFLRQKEKIISALALLDADVIGMMEIQNSSAAVADLIAALNSEVGDPYAIVPDPPGGYPVAGVAGDFIRCLFLYRPSKVGLSGPCFMDTDTVWLTPDPLRFPLAQVFEENSTGERIVICVNHWKSKSSVGASGLNVDQNDGQASFTELRRQQATRLHTWLQGVSASVGDNDLLIIGDLNSNGEEDPLDILRANGYTDQVQRFHPGDYSYVLGGKRGRLDHAFASSSMNSQIFGSEHWKINSDEPAFYDYNTENKSAAHLLLNVGTPFRSSDHDPVLIGVSLSPQPTTYAMWVASRIWPLGASTLPEADADGDGLKNLMEFILNSDPSRSDLQHAPVPSYFELSSFQLTYRLRTNAVGVLVQPQWSENLLNWETMNVGTPVLIDDLTQMIPALTPLNGRNRLFGRLRVQVVP